MRRQLYENYVLAIDEILRLKYLIGARAVKGTSVVQRPYDKLMGELLVVMFRLNSLRSTVAASEPCLWGNARKDLVDENLESIVGYVNNLVEALWNGMQAEIVRFLISARSWPLLPTELSRPDSSHYLGDKGSCRSPRSC